MLLGHLLDKHEKTEVPLGQALRRAGMIRNPSWRNSKKSGRIVPIGSANHSNAKMASKKLELSMINELKKARRSGKSGEMEAVDTCLPEIFQSHSFKQKIYSPPPTLQWVNLIRTTFTDNPYGMKIMINDRARNYDGLYQIVQYSSRIACYHELLAMISTDPKILFNPMTYLWAFLILLPRKFIRWIGDLYKCYTLKKLLNSRNLKQNLEKFHIN
jgi:hypothetical protein